MKHKDKVKLARRLRSRGEIKAKVSIFQTKGWIIRKEAIAKRVKRKIEEARKRKEEKKKRKEREK